MGKEEFNCRTTGNLTIFKFDSSDGYKKAVDYFNGMETNNRTYELKGKRSYSAVLRNMYPEDIKGDVENKGFKVRNISNVMQKANRDSH